MENKESAVACSLGAGDMEKRGQEWKRLLEANLIEQRDIPGGIRLLLRPSHYAPAEVRRLAALENACCAWITWSITEGANLQVDATTDQTQGTELLRAWFGSTATGGHP